MSWLLRVGGLTKLYGPGCPMCLEATGSEQATNECAACGTLVACADISLVLEPGETLGLVGESGSGKSSLLACLYGDETVTRGDAYLRTFADGRRSIFEASVAERRQLRDFHMGMVYQHPHRGIDLAISAGGNVAERLMASEWRRVDDIRERAGALLVRMEVPRSRMDDLPAFFSGGMQQRVQIAKVLANAPSLLLLDEITSGLDVSVQAGVLDLVGEIQQQTGVAMLVVSHDLAVIRLLAERTIVMRFGRVVEAGLTDQVFEDPQHPYTQLLVSSVNR